MTMTINTMMKAAVVKAFGEPLVIEHVPVPQPGSGQILVKIAATGVCHTDLHAAEGDWPVKPVPPFIPGHEGVGQVVAVGDNVHHLKVGDRVGVPWLYSACGHCEHCLDNWETLCHSQQNTGYSVTAVLPNTAWRTPTMSASSPKTWRSTRWHRCSVRA